MLRLIVVLLALANGVFFAWHAGWLPMLPGSSTAATGSAHTSSQVHPERLVVLNAPTPPGVLLAATSLQGSAGSAPASASEPALASALGTEPASQAEAKANTAATPDSASAASQPPAADTRCVEAGPFTPDENRQALTQLGKVLPKGSWATQAVSVPGLWLVYMGPYPDADALQKKLLELRRLKGLNFEEVRSPSNLALGVSLGRFADERQANAALETMRLRGVRTARVVNARPSMELLVLRVPQASEADQGKLSALPLPAGKGFIACAG